MDAFALKFAKSKVILGYHWGYSDYLADFAIVHTLGIEFYKLYEHPMRLMLMKAYSFSASQYWFEPHSGSIVLAHTPTKPGTMRSYHFYQSKTTKFDGGRFKLVQQVPASVRWTTRLPNCFTLTASTAISDIHRCALAKVYNEVLFLHLSTHTGQLQLYKVETDRVELLPFCITQAPGIYDLFVIDSVIVVQSPQEEFFYDIKEMDFQGDPFVVVKYGAAAVEEGASDLVDVAISGRQKVGRIEKQETLVTGLTRVDQDIFVDTMEGLCYRKEIPAVELIASQDDLTIQLLFLLRRNNCKVAALAHLRQQIQNQAPLSSLSDFFATISQVYRTAALERQGSPTRRHTSPDLRQSLNLEGEVKAESGITVILQTDVYNHVLLDIFEDKSLPQQYVTSVLLEYQRALVDADIRVNPSIQLLIAKHLTQARNYILLQSLLQYRVLADSTEISHLLVAIANPENYAHYAPALQLAIDMLARLSDFREIANLLLERKLFYEVALCLESQPRSVIEPVIEVLKQEKDSQLAATTREFLSRSDRRS